jgi:hypothetical protein
VTSRAGVLAGVVASALVAGVTAGCSQHALGLEEARLAVARGAEVRVLVVGTGWRKAQSGELLRHGDRVEVRRGTARLALARRREIELRPLRDAGGSARADVQIGAVPRLRTGEVLLVAGQVPLSLTANDTDVLVAAGAARVSQIVGNVVAASYEGGLTVRSAGRTLTVPALRQTTVVVAGLVQGRPSPLRYDARDPFDQRYLGAAIALGDELSARVRALSDNLRLVPDADHAPGFFRELLPRLEGEGQLPELLTELDAHAQLDGARLAASEKLVGAAIAAQGRGSAFAARWRATFGFRNEGADWGLVARDQRVGRAQLLADLDLALGRRELTPIASPAALSAMPQPSTASAPSATTAPPSTAPALPSPHAPASPRPLPVSPPAPVVQPPSPPTTAPVNAVVDTLVNLLRGLPTGKPR